MIANLLAYTRAGVYGVTRNLDELSRNVLIRALS